MTVDHLQVDFWKSANSMTLGVTLIQSRARFSQFWVVQVLSSFRKHLVSHSRFPADSGMCMACTLSAFRLVNKWLFFLSLLQISLIVFTACLANVNFKSNKADNYRQMYGKTVKLFSSSTNRGLPPPRGNRYIFFAAVIRVIYIETGLARCRFTISQWKAWDVEKYLIAISLNCTR